MTLTLQGNGTLNGLTVLGAPVTTLANTGTAASPSLVFDGDSDTGLFRPGANQLGLSVGGSARLTIASDGITTFTNDVNIGGYNGGSTSTDGVLFGAGGGVFSQMTAATAGTGILFQGMHGTTPTFSVSAAGSVFIGGSYSDTANHSQTTINAGGTFIQVPSTATNSTTALVVKKSSSDGSPSSTVASLNGDGSATFTSDAQFGTGAADARITIGSHGTAGTNNSVHIRADSQNLLFMSGSGGITKFEQNGTARVVIDANGKLLVNLTNARTNFFNTTAYGSLVNFEGTGNSNRIVSHVHNDSSGGPMLVLGATGGNTVGNNDLVANTTTYGILSFQGSDGNDLIEAARISAETDGTPAANDMPGAIVFSTTSDGNDSVDRRMVITGDGYLRLHTNSPGIQFNNDTAAANALDDYEEGTWTPVLKSGTNTITYSGGNSQFTYTKVGRIVTVNFTLNNETTAGTTGGTFVVEGLPFAAISTQSNRFIGTIVNYYNLGLYLNGWPAYVHLDANQSKINVYYKTAANGQYDAANVSNVGSSSFMQWQVTYFV